MKKSFNMVFLLSIPMIFGIVVVSKSFVPVFFGKGYEKVAILMSVISPIILLIGLSNVTGTQYLLPTKRQKQYTVSVIIGAITNLVLNFIFIPKFLSIGAAIGTVIAEVTVTGVQFYCIRKEFNIREILTMSFKYLLSALIMLIVITILNSFILTKYSALFRIGMDVVCGMTIYLLVLIILRDQFINKLINKVLKQKNKGEVL